MGKGWRDPACTIPRRIRPGGAVATRGLRVARDAGHREEAAAKTQELEELAGAKAGVDSELAQLRSLHQALEKTAAQMSSELQSLRSQLAASSADADAAKVCFGLLLLLAVRAIFHDARKLVCL